MSRRGGAPQLTVIWWGGIPAQVTARDGARTAKASLPGRFQAAIDRAAMRAGVVGSDAYLQLWERRSRPCSSDLRAEVDAEVAQLDDRFPPAELTALVRATPAHAPSTHGKDVHQ